VRAAIAIAVVATAGCGDDGPVTALEGMYELTSWTLNPDGCDQEGPAAEEEETFSHFYVKQEDTLGVRAVGVTLCESLGECRNYEANSDGSDVFMLFRDGDDESGWSTPASEVIGTTDCCGLVTGGRLTGVPATSVRIERETRSACVPLEDNTCDLDGLVEQAASQPCEQLGVVQGSYVEAI
jgi:hypothetical protein